MEARRPSHVARRGPMCGVVRAPPARPLSGEYKLCHFLAVLKVPVGFWMRKFLFWGELGLEV